MKKECDNCRYSKRWHGQRPYICLNKALSEFWNNKGHKQYDKYVDACGLNFWRPFSRVQHMRNRFWAWYHQEPKTKECAENVTDFMNYKLGSWRKAA